MHTGEAEQPSLQDKWLADLLSKALLLEYQRPAKPTKRKPKRKKQRSQGTKTRTAALKSLSTEIEADAPLSLDAAQSMYALAAASIGSFAVYQPGLGYTGQQASWQLEDVPVFHLFAQVKRLLGRYIKVAGKMLVQQVV